MTIHDYNGTGAWSPQGLAARYQEHAKRLHVEVQTDLTPTLHTKGDTQWIYPVMEKVILGIEAGDPACAELGIDFISQDASFPFGRTLKSNTARAMRRATLSEQQRARVRQRVLQMLVEGYLPREYREYAKLLRKIGLGAMRAELEQANLEDHRIVRYVKYFEALS